MATSKINGGEKGGTVTNRDEISGSTVAGKEVERRAKAPGIKTPGEEVTPKQDCRRHQVCC